MDLHKLLKRAKKNKKNGNNPQALAELNKADRFSPNNPEVLKLRGNVKRLLNDNEGALADVERANELQEDDPDTLSYRGAIKRKMGDYKGAVEDLDKADKMLPNNAFILRHRGAAKRLLPTPDLQGSLEDLRTANQLSPNNAFNLQHLGAILRALGYFQEAVEALQASNVKNPRQALTLRHLGASLRAIGHYQEALAVLNESLELDPTHAFAYRQRALTRAQLLDYEGAWQDACTALELYPKSTEAQQLREELGVVRGVAKSGDDIMHIPNGELIFRQNHILGFGGSGYVRLAEWRSLKVAVKTVSASAPYVSLTHEAKALLYKHIIGLIAVSNDPVTEDLQIIMEYAEQSSLRDFIRKNGIQLHNGDMFIIQLALDIAKALTYLHAQTPKVIHRDLKSENILLFSNNGKTRAKISDFGTVKFAITQVHHSTVIGAVGIPLPPEMADEVGYDEKVDIFSFGVVLLEMLLRERRAQVNIGQIQNRINDGDPLSDLFQIVLDCCQTNPQSRPSAQQLVERLKALKHKSQ